VGSRKFPNRNRLIRQMPESDGMKTGFVCNSGFNLVASASRGGRRLIAIVLGADSSQTRAELAQMLLTDGLGRDLQWTVSGSAIARPGSARRPTDAAADVCKRKAPVTVASAKALGGWGISFGDYVRPRSRPARQSCSAGQHRGPAAKWASFACRWPRFLPCCGTSIGRCRSVCAGYRAQDASCQIMRPEVFAELAALVKEPPPKPQKPVTQGSDAGGTKKKKKRVK
jgi:hypothetical protein